MVTSFSNWRRNELADEGWTKRPAIRKFCVQLAIFCRILSIIIHRLYNVYFSNAGSFEVLSPLLCFVHYSETQFTYMSSCSSYYDRLLPYFICMFYILTVQLNVAFIRVTDCLHFICLVTFCFHLMASTMAVFLPVFLWTAIITITQLF